jgi:hypothetical protein
MLGGYSFEEMSVKQVIWDLRADDTGSPGCSFGIRVGEGVQLFHRAKEQDVTVWVQHSMEFRVGFDFREYSKHCLRLHNEFTEEGLCGWFPSLRLLIWNMKRRSERSCKPPCFPKYL